MYQSLLFFYHFQYKEMYGRWFIFEVFPKHTLQATAMRARTGAPPRHARLRHRVIVPLPGRGAVRVDRPTFLSYDDANKTVPKVVNYNHNDFPP